MTQEYDYTIKYSKNNLPIPVVNGVHLHSIYNPTKEAETFVEKNEATLKNKNYILLFGLGFGYHLHAIENKMKEFHDKNFKILVIEPNSSILNDYKKINPKTSENVSIIASKSAEELYRTKEFIDVLIERPGIISHTASFNLNEPYFRKIMSFKAKKEIAEVCSHINNPEAKSILQSYEMDKSIEDIAALLFEEALNGSLSLSKNDFLIQAYNSI